MTQCQKMIPTVEKVRSKDTAADVAAYQSVLTALSNDSACPVVLRNADGFAAEAVSNDLEHFRDDGFGADDDSHSFKEAEDDGPIEFAIDLERDEHTGGNETESDCDSNGPHGSEDTGTADNGWMMNIDADSNHFQDARTLLHRGGVLRILSDTYVMAEYKNGGDEVRDKSF
jgi:hypothetical protein